MMKDAMKSWYAIDILTEPAATEAVEFALNELNSFGTEIDSLRKPKGEPLRVSGYFNEPPEIADVADVVNEALRIYGFSPDSVTQIDGRRVEETDWLAEWKRHWKPTVIDGFIIAPPWETVDDTSKIVIRIEPNMAFGTGTHETTQLCLREIGNNLKAGETFLDVGTGTGILAIAAAKLATENTDKNEKQNQNTLLNSVSSVAKILACDTDEDSIRIAIENAELNGVGGRIKYFHGSIGPDTPRFDFVCANLTIDVILPMLPLLIEKTTGLLLLSGILVEQQELIAAELKKFQISNFRFETAGEWISVTVDVS